MIVAIRGNVFGNYMKVGYNVVRRWQRGADPDDNVDYFMWIGASKNLETAKTLQKKQEFETEIREFKIQQLEKNDT